MKKSALAGCILLFLLVACGGSQTDLVSSTEEITGTWSSSSGLQFTRFGEDGAFQAEPSLALINDPVRSPGEDWFEGAQLHLKTTGDAVCGDAEAVYEVRRLESGNLSFVAVEDACEPRLSFLQGVLDRETGEPSVEFAPVE
jgi:hypothetical protein